MTRRESMRLTGAAVAAATLGFPAILRAGSASSIRRLMVLGIDGMDPVLASSFMNKGLMPHCARLSKLGCFSPLRTTVPPQSPVAWSTFISGLNPGGHGIYDFITRDALTMVPILSTTKIAPSKHTLNIGNYTLPLSSAKPEMLRQGPTLWKLLEEQGILSTIYKAPVNFPPVDSDSRTLSGMTTPDIHGSYGIFSYYTSSPRERNRQAPGGAVHRVQFHKQHAECKLTGPVNVYRQDMAAMEIPFKVDLDPKSPLARVRIQNADLLLAEGGWSDWVTVHFNMLPLVGDITGICRFYLKKARPHLELYVSPINIDPANPAMPISTPKNYARELAAELGPFYTQGMPEDTSALSAKVLDDSDYRSQAMLVLDERLRAYQHELTRFKDGFFFFYFSSLDLNSHAFFRTLDVHHPLYTEKLARQHGDFIPWLYRQMDQVVGMAMDRIDPNTALLVMSDHGFTTFRRQFNLNAWLMDNGYAQPKNRFQRGRTDSFQNVDWSKTAAYGLGINGLYLNLKGREVNGIVDRDTEADALMNRLTRELTAIRDPLDGQPAIHRVIRSSRYFQGACLDLAPDMIVCYNNHYRASWDTILGKYPKQIMLDNTDPWSGDHCMDPEFIPGTLISNLKLTQADPGLEDLAPTILRLFGVPPAAGMKGRMVFNA